MKSCKKSDRCHTEAFNYMIDAVSTIRPHTDSEHARLQTIIMIEINLTILLQLAPNIDVNINV